MGDLPTGEQVQEVRFTLDHERAANLSLIHAVVGRMGRASSASGRVSAYMDLQAAIRVREEIGRMQMAMLDLYGNRPTTPADRGRLDLDGD